MMSVRSRARRLVVLTSFAATRGVRLAVAGVCGAVVAASEPASLPAQQAEDPDIFLASISTDGGRLRIERPRNITSRPGYDNQPAFSHDGASLYFTSTRGDAQADIYRYTIASGKTSRVTTTAPESEYSASEVPSGGAIAVIRVERDSAQRLWRLPVDGGAGVPLFPTLKPVGYHAWADSARVAMFVLGSPPVLVLGNVQSGRLDTLVASIGRSLHRIPGSRNVSFVSKAYEENWWIMELDVESHGIRPLARLPKGTEDYAWLPDGRLVAGSGSKVFLCDVSKRSVWEEVVDLGDAGISGITRLAISPAGDRLALVAVSAGR